MKKLFRNILYIFSVSIFLAACKDDYMEETNFIDGRPDSNGGVTETNPFWDWTNFPGPISKNLKRLGKDTVNFFVEGDYELDLFMFGDSGDTVQAPSPWFGPGLYAAIMEPITVEVPEGVVNLRCLVGSHPSFLGYGYNQRNPKPRWSDIQDTVYLKPGKNTFSSYFGGMIYFTWDPDTKPVKPGVDVVISGGCVRANNYIAGVTDYDSWIQSIRANYVKDTIGVDEAGNLIVQDGTSDALKWVEMIGKYAIVTCPYEEFKDCDNPATCLEAIDNWVRGYCEFNAFPLVQKNGKLLPQRRIVSDIAGPTINRFNKETVYALPVQQFYRGQYISKGLWDYDFMTLSASRNRLITEMLMYPNRARAHAIANIFPTEFMKYFLAARFYHKLPVGAYDLPYLCSDENPNRALPKRMQDAATVTACLISLVNEFDWGLIPYTMAAARAARYSGRGVSGMVEEHFAMHACEYTNLNLEGFFDSWHWELPAYALEYMRKFPAPETEFWLHYRDRIADYNPEMPEIKTTVPREGPIVWWPSKDEKKLWGVKSGMSATDARKAIDGSQDEKHSLMANNIEQKDAWVEIDFHDTLHINRFHFLFPNAFVGIARSAVLKLGNYTDEAKTQINWEYVKDSKGEPMEFRFRCWKGQGNDMNLPKMYRAELARVEIVTMGYHRNFIDINPWPTTAGVGELNFGRSEYPMAHPSWPYPYIPPVED